jgi:hypothetical protein
MCNLVVFCSESKVSKIITKTIVFEEIYSKKACLARIITFFTRWWLWGGLVELDKLSKLVGGEMALAGRQMSLSFEQNSSAWGGPSGLRPQHCMK